MITIYKYYINTTIMCQYIVPCWSLSTKQISDLPLRKLGTLYP